MISFSPRTAAAMVTVATVLLAATLGCGDADLVDHSQDPERFAASTKETSLAAIADARSSDEPADALEMLASELDPHELQHRPTGDYGDVYQQMFTIASELFQAADQMDARPANLDSKLDELESLARSLPGEAVDYHADDDDS